MDGTGNIRVNTQGLGGRPTTPTSSTHEAQQRSGENNLPTTNATTNDAAQGMTQPGGRGFVSFSSGSVLPYNAPMDSNAYGFSGPHSLVYENHHVTGNNPNIDPALQAPRPHNIPAHSFNLTPGSEGGFDFQQSFGFDAQSMSQPVQQNFMTNNPGTSYSGFDDVEEGPRGVARSASTSSLPPAKRQMRVSSSQHQHGGQAGGYNNSPRDQHLTSHGHGNVDSAALSRVRYGSEATFENNMPYAIPMAAPGYNSITGPQSSPAAATTDTSLTVTSQEAAKPQGRDERSIA